MLRTFPLVLALCCASCTDDDVAPIAPAPDPDPPVQACEVGVELSGVFSAPADTKIPDEFTVGLLQFGDQALDKPLLLGAVSELTADGAVRWSVCLPEVPDEGWFAGAGGAPIDVAAFVVGAWVDRVQDGIPSVGEALIGVEFTVVAYVRGEVDQELAALGADVGWNVIGMDLTVDPPRPIRVEPFSQGYTTYDVEANLAPHTYTSLAVTVEPSSDDTVTVGLYAMHEMFGLTRPKNATVAATTMTQEGSVELTGFEGAPPGNHLVDDLQDGTLAVAVYAGVAFVDADQNWQFDQDERLLAASFTEQAQISVVYIQPRRFYASLLMQRQGMVAGWSIGEIDQDQWPERAPWADGLHLSAVD